MKQLLAGYWSWRPFTDNEAWMLFKLAAIAEACGWTLLILGILCKRFIIPGNDIPVQLAGHTHGILFLMYIMAALVLAPSLRWSWRRTIIAGIASVPPYGSLLFELWAAHNRQATHYKQLSRLLIYTLLLNNRAGSL